MTVATLMQPEIYIAIIWAIEQTRELTSLTIIFMAKDGYSAVCKVTGNRVNLGEKFGLELPC